MNKLAELIASSIKEDSKVLIMGNGGLCAEAEHFAAELVGKYAFDIHLPCLSLTCNTSLLTALANDYGYENIFSHQIKVFGKPDDICICMTTSNSKNIIQALKQAESMAMTTVLICGNRYVEFGHIDFQFVMQGKDTAEIQNETIKFLHKLAYEIKRRLVC